MPAFSFHDVVARPIALALLFATGVVACDPSQRPPRAAGAEVIIDDVGDTLVIGAPPQRIVSLNPSTTEVLFAIGAGARVVGRTTWDRWPDSARLVPDLGSALPPNVEAVLAAHPTLVLLYAGEDTRSAARALRRAGVPTLTLRTDRVADFVRTTRMLARATGDTLRARLVVDSVSATLERVRRATAGRARVTAFWKVWDRPLMTIGRGSFLSELVTIAGGTNLYDDLPSPSPTVTIEDVARRNPDVIFVTAGTEAALRSAAPWQAVRAVREHHFVAVDESLVGRPGVRLGEAAMSLARLLHPEVTP